MNPLIKKHLFSGPCIFVILIVGSGCHSEVITLDNQHEREHRQQIEMQQEKQIQEQRPQQEQFEPKEDPPKQPQDDSLTKLNMNTERSSYNDVIAYLDLTPKSTENSEKTSHSKIHRIYTEAALRLVPMKTCGIEIRATPSTDLPKDPPIILQLDFNEEPVCFETPGIHLLADFLTHKKVKLNKANPSPRFSWKALSKMLQTFDSSFVQDILTKRERPYQATLTVPVKLGQSPVFIEVLGIEPLDYSVNPELTDLEFSAFNENHPDYYRLTRTTSWSEYFRKMSSDTATCTFNFIKSAGLYPISKKATNLMSAGGSWFYDKTTTLCSAVWTSYFVRRAMPHEHTD